MDRELDRIKLRLLTSLLKLGYWAKEDDLLSLEYPDCPELRKLKLIAVVEHLDENLRDPGNFIKAGLKDEDRDVKKTAMKLISQLNDDRLLEDLATLLEDKEDSIAQMASETIRHLRTEEEHLLQPLIAFIKNEEKNLTARLLAIKSLNYSNDSTIILDTLVSLLTNPNLNIRIEASKAIKYILDHELVLNSILHLLLNEPEKEIELSLIWGIANIKSQKIVEYLKPYMNHEKLEFQEAAIYGIGNSGYENLTNDLLAKLENIEHKK